MPAAPNREAVGPPALYSMTQTYEKIDFGFSTADANKPQIEFRSSDLHLEFIDWRENSQQIDFQEVIGVQWNDELNDARTIRDDCCYLVHSSEWLAEHFRSGNMKDDGGYRHYKLCFNAWGVLDVLCRQYEFRQ